MAVPRTPDELTAVLNNRESAWEWEAYGGALLIERARHIEAYRDDRVRFAAPWGDFIDVNAAFARLSPAMDDALGFADRLMRMLDPAVLEEAFGAPGDPGDAELILHLARRTLATWRMFLVWAADLRGVRAPRSVRPVLEAAADLAREPIEQVYRWIDDYVGQLDDGLARVAADPTQPVVLTSELLISIPDEYVEAFEDRLRDLGRSVRDTTAVIGAQTATADWIALGLTTALVITTIVYAKLTYRLANAAEDALEQERALRRRERSERAAEACLTALDELGAELRRRPHGAVSSAAYGEAWERVVHRLAMIDDRSMGDRMLSVVGVLHIRALGPEQQRAEGLSPRLIDDAATVVIDAMVRSLVIYLANSDEEHLADWRTAGGEELPKPKDAENWVRAYAQAGRP